MNSLALVSKRPIPKQISSRPQSENSTSSLASTPVLSPIRRSSSNLSAMESDVEEISPKVEELCESPREIQVSFEGENLISPSSIISIGNSQKKRGRPRKSTDTVPAKPSTKLGRTKTGCLTCRQRKKKCDEGKPECRNCMKNGLRCLGYVGKIFWQPGKNPKRKSIVNEMIPQSSIPRALRSITPGIESDVDVKFLDHYFFDLSNVLTVHDNASNPFKDIIFRMAIDEDDNLLLRHSLLCFAGLHLYRRDPKKIFNDRQQYHYQNYLNLMLQDCKKATADEGNVCAVDQRLMITTSIVQCLIAICRGSTDGEYRWHMDLVREFVPGYQSSDPAVQDFFYEFLMYHDGLNVTTSLDRRPASIIEEDEQSSLLITTQPDGVFTGVKDGLLKFIIEISRLRDRIRLRVAEGVQPVRDYSIISRSLKIEQDLKAWIPVHEPGTPTWYFACFHQQCVWIYLHRTLKPSRPSEGLTIAVDDALKSLKDLHATESTQSVLLSPLFLLGCAAFQEWQRPPIETAFENLRTYSNLGNIDQAQLVVRKVWELMDADDERSWDWERIMADMGVDLLIT